MAQQSKMNLRALTDRLREKARRKVPEADVEDLVQDVLVVLVEKTQDHQIGAIQPYAEGILRHLIYDYYQKRAEYKVPLDGNDAESHDVSPEQRVFWQRHLRVVREVSQENPVDEALLQEHFFSGAPLREVASELGVSAGVVNGRLFRFRQKLLQRVGQIFTVLMALGVGLWSRVSRALFVGRLHHATSWTVALLSVSSAGTWWAQFAPEKQLLLPTPPRVSSSLGQDTTTTHNESNDPWIRRSQKTSETTPAPAFVGVRSSIFFHGQAHSSRGQWGWWGSPTPSASQSLFGAASSDHPSALSAHKKRSLGELFSGAALLAQPQALRGSRLEQNNTSVATSGASATGGRELAHGRSTASRNEQGRSEQGRSEQGRSEQGRDPLDPNAQNKEPASNPDPKQPTTEPQKPNTPNPSTHPDPKQPTQSDARQSFCMKRDGRLYRCDQAGQLGEDISGNNQSSFQCGGDASCRRMVNGEQAGESPVGPALVVGQQNTLIVAGENRYRESRDQGRTWSEPETPPLSDVLLKQAVFVLNQRGEIWQQDQAKKTWSLLRSTHENAELRVHVDATGALCFEDTFDFRYETRIPGIDPVATTRLGGLIEGSGLQMPNMPNLRPTHVPGMNNTTLPTPSADFPQGLPLPLPAPQKQTQLPVIPR